MQGSVFCHAGSEAREGFGVNAIVARLPQTCVAGRASRLSATARFTVSLVPTLRCARTGGTPILQED